MQYKQVRVDMHITPVPNHNARHANRANALEAHYGHCFTTCKYCGWTRHKDYVCSCGVDTGYLEDENGAAVRPLVEVYNVPVKEKA